MNQCKGVSLIEILISFFIFSLLLLGLDAMQVTALRQAKANYYFTVATQQAQSMAEYLRVIKEDNWQPQFNLWNKQNKEVLPQGRGMIQGHYPSYTLTIFWGKETSLTCENNKTGQSGCINLVIHF